MGAMGTEGAVGAGIAMAGPLGRVAASRSMARAGAIARVLRKARISMAEIVEPSEAVHQRGAPSSPADWPMPARAGGGDGAAAHRLLEGKTVGAGEKFPPAGIAGPGQRVGG